MSTIRFGISRNMSNRRCNLLKPTPRFLKRIIPRNWNTNAKINQRPKYWPTILNNQWYNYLQLLYFGGDWVQFGHDNSDKVCRKRTVILFTIDLLLPVNWSYANWQGWICELACTCNVTLRPFSLSEVNHLHTGPNGLDTCRIATVDRNGDK